MARRGGRGRAPEEFSLSFLDGICCGFGAIILLLMITKTAEPQIIEASTVNLEGTVVELQQQVFDIRGETKILNRDLNAKEEQLSDYEQRIAILRGQMASVKSRYDSLQVESSSNSAILGQLAVAKQTLTEEMERLLGTQYQSKNRLIGGIPVDSEWIIFVIDTSPSMQDYWDRVLKEVKNTLEIYPSVKGFQVLNGEGQYLYQGYRGKWINDSPSRRREALKRLKTWKPPDSSSIQKGIKVAIDTFGKGDKKISIYVFGDDFTGGSTEALVRYIERSNKSDRRGKQIVRIHAIGFPTDRVNNPDGFANLMRQLSSRNGGAFVGLK